MKLVGTLTGRQTLVGVLTVPSTGCQHPHYRGEYIVTPLAWEETILETDGKVMDNDVTVLEVPYAEVSNLHGTTVTIAS